MPGSLNAIDVTARVAAIPQLHIGGANERVIPPSVTRSFVAAVGPCAQLRILEGVAHESDWAARWPALRFIALTCS